MDYLDSSQIIDPATRQPFTGPSLAFLQAGTRDIIQALAQTFIGNSYNPSTPYALIGIVGPSGPITGGYILWQNEVFRCAGYGPAIVNTAQFNVVVTQDVTVDPLTFSDGTTKNVANERRIVITDSVTAGAFNYSNIVHLDSTFILPAWTNATLTFSWTSSSTPKYRIVQDRVELTGVMTNATVANAANSAFVIPANMRPIVDTCVWVAALNNGTVYIRSMFITASTGTFALDTTGFANVTTTVYLNGVRWVTT